MALNYNNIIQVIGLDNSGKSTILRNFDKNNKLPILPTTNIQLINSKFGNEELKVIFLDCSGNGRFRDNWSKNFKDIDGLIYVLDIKNKTRYQKDKELLRKILKDDIIRKYNIPIMILLNKIDDIEDKEVETDRFKEFFEIDKYNTDNLKIIFRKVSGKDNTHILDSFNTFLNIINKK